MFHGQRQADNITGEVHMSNYNTCDPRWVQGRPKQCTVEKFFQRRSFSFNCRKKDLHSAVKKNLNVSFVNKLLHILWSYSSTHCLTHLHTVTESLYLPMRQVIFTNCQYLIFLMCFLRQVFITILSTLWFVQRGVATLLLPAQVHLRLKRYMHTLSACM